MVWLRQRSLGFLQLQQLRLLGLLELEVKELELVPMELMQRVILEQQPQVELKLEELVLGRQQPEVVELSLLGVVEASLQLWAVS